MSRTLWQKHTYIAKTEYIIGTVIREFDISKANISVLRDANIITEEQYQYYLHCDRMERQIAIGKLQGSNPEVVDILKSGITNARRVFMESNNIDDSEILYIRNDAICIVGTRYIVNLNITEHVSFRESGRYSSFYRYGSISLLYLYDVITQTECLEVKGLGDEGEKLHKNFMLDFLSELFYRAQVEGIEIAMKTLQDFHTSYISKSLDVGYYREFNSASNYKIFQFEYSNSVAYLRDALEYHKQFIDISYNEAVLRHFNKIFASIYFK